MTNESDPGLRAEGLLKLGDRIRYASLLRLAFGAVVLAFAWYVVEHRETVVPALLANQLIMTLSAIGAVLIILAPVFAWAISRSDAQTMESRRLMQELIDDARGDLTDYKAEVTGELMKLRANESKCQRALARMTQALKDHGIEPPENTGWGDLGGAPPR